MSEPPRALRLWIMVVVGASFIALGLAEIARAWIATSQAPADLEIALALIGAGMVMLFFGTPDLPEAERIMTGPLSSRRPPPTEETDREA